MRLILEGNSYKFEIENICRLFLPEAAFEISGDTGDGDFALAAVRGNKLFAQLCLEGRYVQAEEALAPSVSDKERERSLAVLLYRLFAELMGKELLWGAVTGVRPVKLFRRLSAQAGEEAAADWFRKKLLVSNQKTELCRRVLHTENEILSFSQPRSFSLYIGIPFCPSRCDYCSFVSHTITRAGALIPDYVKCLLEEIGITAEITHKLGLRLETVYMGGGTPTTLDAEQLRAVLGMVSRSFDMSTVREFCVEAGRPDTVTCEKLAAIRECGADRISINPQTLSGDVLAGIGRRHTVEQFYEAFEMARRCGFGHINADLIAGLPGDNPGGFAESINGLTALSPESITVHSLAMKRASSLVTEKKNRNILDEDAVRMISCGEETLTASGYHPYYLYRQSRTAGNMENVGWSRPGYEGLYNVYIMDETHSIFGCGAGAVTKLRQPGSEYIERFFNYKFPYEYIGRFDEMLKRKAQAGEACAKLLNGGKI